MRGVYQHHPGQGFLHPVHQWQVQVGRGIVFNGTNARDAAREYSRLTKLSGDTIGKLSGQSVYLIKDGKIEATNNPV